MFNFFSEFSVSSISNIYLDSIQCSHGLSPGSVVKIAIPVINLLKLPAHNSNMTTPAPNNVTYTEISTITRPAFPKAYSAIFGYGDGQ